jgi:predicted TIM-barrel fold metal-dependent hydrolase
MIVHAGFYRRVEQLDCRIAGPHVYRTSTVIIDTHQHVFWRHRDDAGLVADMDENGIDLAWLLTWEIGQYDALMSWHGALNPARVRPDGSHPGITLEDGLRARDRYPNRFVAGYCPHPTHPEAVNLFEAAYYMYGVRVCGEWKFRMLIDDPRCLELFRAAGRLNCPVVLHLDVPYLTKSGKAEYQRDWYGGTIDNLERALRACPETNFIGHAPGFWREISGDASIDPANYPKGPIVPAGRLFALLDNNPNLFADLSANSGKTAMSRDPAHAREFLHRYADRMLFGRDIYGSDLQKFLATLDLPADVANKIYYENAQRLMSQKSHVSPLSYPSP